MKERGKFQLELTNLWPGSLPAPATMPIMAPMVKRIATTVIFQCFSQAPRRHPGPSDHSLLKLDHHLP